MKHKNTRKEVIVKNMEDPSSQPMRDGIASLESHASPKAVRIAQGSTTGKDSVADLQRDGGNTADLSRGTERHGSPKQGGAKNLEGIELRQDEHLLQSKKATRVSGGIDRWK